MIQSLCNYKSKNLTTLIYKQILKEFKNQKEGYKMTISKDKIRMSLIIKKDLKEKIEKEAKKENRSVNNLINTVLMEYLNKKKEGK